MAGGFVCDGAPVALDCVVCSTRFEYIKTGPGRLRRTCSTGCRKVRSTRSIAAVACLGCGKAFHPRHTTRSSPETHGSYCSVSCRPQSARVYIDLRSMRNAQEHRRRARKRGGSTERFEAVEIYERDGWTCGICGQPVDPAVPFPDHMSASLDHVVPLACGGAHRRDNVQCSHWVCNSRKSHRPEARPTSR